MSARQGSVGARAPTHTLRWISLGALGAGALLGIFQPLVMVAVGGFGIAAGPSWVGLLFMLCVALLLIVGVIAMVSGGSRGTTVPILAVSGMLALGLIGGNMTASALDIGFAQPRAEPSFVPADPDGPEWTRSGSMLEARHGHTATLLPDGRVLVAGGYTTSWSVMASAELYDPITGRWSATGSLHVPAAEHVAVLLDGGGVLVVSTVPGQHDAEVWSPGTGTWEAVDEMAAPHGRGLTATALADGRVLVTGGFTTADEPLATAEIYDPGSDTWTTTAPMGTPRHGHTATLLADGRVLVVGGMSA
ncbi:MAG TPA: kelch repeat-containing protein, partial [Candidatus Limnocylindria bacterium]